MFTLLVNNISGKEVGKVELDEKVFDGKVNESLIHQVTVMYQANKRQGTSSTKTRANVSGGNSKPWRQKGTGKARVGSSRSPIWRKGGDVFGPHPRDYSYQLPKKIKKSALISTINSRLNDNLVKVLDELRVVEGKTKEFIKIVAALKLERKVLFVCENTQENVLRSSRNIKKVNIMRWESINALDVLLHDNVVITQKALENLTQRLKKGE
ncbi:MAG: 50S ribosomal protein L4 [Candidatus Omnitrophica bacterium]|nr:50S ribosomal protein L4 [Candidatus Omnitrophota bacterium]